MTVQKKRRVNYNGYKGFFQSSKILIIKHKILECALQEISLVKVLNILWQ